MINTSFISNTPLLAINKVMILIVNPLGLYIIDS